MVIGLGKILVGELAGFFHERAMSDDHTTAAVERYMIALAGDAPAGLDLGAVRQDVDRILTDSYRLDA